MQVSITSFIDFVGRSGSTKLAFAKTIQSQLADPEYDNKDHYQTFRAGIGKYHSEGGEKKDLIQLMDGLPSNRKDSYRALVEGYLKFLGKNTFQWFQPPTGAWKQGNIHIPLMPTLGLETEERKMIVYLHVKAEKPTRDQVSLILTLLNACFAETGHTIALLDVRNSKLHIFENDMLPLLPLLAGEATLLEHLLKTIAEPGEI